LALKSEDKDALFCAETDVPPFQFAPDAQAQRMEIVLNEFSLSLLVGLVGFITFWITNAINNLRGDSGGNGGNSNIRSRANSKHLRRLDSNLTKNEHVLFADEFDEDAPKHNPILAGEEGGGSGEEDHEGILHNKEEVRENLRRIRCKWNYILCSFKAILNDFCT